MINVPKEIQLQFNSILLKKLIPVKARLFYRKWLRYYLDFCYKYHFSANEIHSLPHFVEKLKMKKQNEFQIMSAFSAF